MDVSKRAIIPALAVLLMSPGIITPVTAQSTATQVPRLTPAGKAHVFSANTIEEAWSLISDCVHNALPPEHDLTLIFTFYPHDGTVSVPRVAYNGTPGNADEKKAVGERAVRAVAECTPIKMAATSSPRLLSVHFTSKDPRYRYSIRWR